MSRASRDLSGIPARCVARAVDARGEEPVEDESAAGVAGQVDAVVRGGECDQVVTWTRVPQVVRTEFYRSTQRTGPSGLLLLPVVWLAAMAELEHEPAALQGLELTGLDMDDACSTASPC